MPTPTLGTALRDGRIKMGLTQEQVAEKLERTKGWVSGVENGNIRPSQVKLGDFSKLLGLDPTELLALYFQEESNQLSEDERELIRAYRHRDLKALARIISPYFFPQNNNN